MILVISLELVLTNMIHDELSKDVEYKLYFNFLEMFENLYIVSRSENLFDLKHKLNRLLCLKIKNLTKIIIVSSNNNKFVQNFIYNLVKSGLVIKREIIRLIHQYPPNKSIIMCKFHNWFNNISNYTRIECQNILLKIPFILSEK